MKRKTTFLFILVVTFTATFIPSIIIAQGNSNSQPENELSTNLIAFGEYAPDWTLKEVVSDIDVSLSYYQGKVVIIDFFAFGASACVDQFHPYLKDVRAYYSSSQLAIVSINTNSEYENLTYCREQIEFYDIPWGVFRDEDQSVSDDYDVRTIPTFYIITKNQIVSYAHTGVVSDAFLIDKLDELITPERTPNEWWSKNWWWFAGGVIVVGVLSAMLIQRRRVILHNRRVDEQMIEAKRRKRRRKER